MAGKKTKAEKRRAAALAMQVAAVPLLKSSKVGEPFGGSTIGRGMAHAELGKIATEQHGDVTKVNPATHGANLRAKAQLAEAVGMSKPATATTSRERSAAMDDWSHAKKLERDARFQATQDKGTSRRAKRAKAAAKDDYSHVKKLVKDAAYEAKKRRKARGK